MRRNVFSTTYWGVVVFCFFLFDASVHGADTLDPISLIQDVSASLQNGQQSDGDESRSRVFGYAGSDSVASKAAVDCFDSTSDLTTLLQPDLARITFDLDVQACSSPAANGAATVGGTSQLSMSVDRTSRKVISLSHKTKQPVSGWVSLQRDGDSKPFWQIDLSDRPNLFSDAFAAELLEGDYTLTVTAAQTTRVDSNVDLRVSVVNRGDVNGNEQFDQADLAVVDAILQQDIFVAAADVDDDGDNDGNDRRLWTDGLQSTATLSRPLVESIENVTRSLPVESSDEANVLASDLVLLDEPELDNVPVIVETPIDAVPENEEKLIGDINADGQVNFFDFLAFSRSFGPNGDFNPLADLNGDNSVDFPDFLIFSRTYNSDQSISRATPEPNGSPAWMVLVVILCVRQMRARDAN